MQYKTVAGPVGLTISGKETHADAVKKYAAIIQKEAVGGWELDIIQQIPVEQTPGCLAGLLGKKSETIFFNMLVFKKAD